MSEPSNCRIMEGREEQMISSTGDEGSNRGVTFRLAYFLSPTVAPDDCILPEVPSSAFSRTDLNFSCRKKENLKVHFPGWRYPSENWNNWTESMRSLYHPVWKKAGIYDAIMNSTFKIHRNPEIIFGFVEKWCPETNTFMFPWGEATITLEDVMVLGGYSVLGDPVFLQSSESVEVEKELLRARSELIQSKARKPRANLWSQKFMDSGSNIEHEAFLTLWLSRFVFPTKTRDSTVGTHVLSTAFHLARGTKIALAPAVLASLYACLSEMKRALVISYSKKKSMEDEILQLSIFAPFQLVQIWVWERFVSLRPTPLPFEIDQPRFSKWKDLRVKKIGDARSSIDEAGDLFLWRPYSVGSKSLFPQRIYRKEARWIKVGSSIDEEHEILVRWLRVSELVGIDPGCIELYLPHRVAMQFGFDQDVPGPVARDHSSKDMAWQNYNREITNEMLYFPSCFFEPDVTTRYQKWWKNRGPVCSVDLVNITVLGAKSQSKGFGMHNTLSSLRDRLLLKSKKIADLEKSSNKRQRKSKRFKSLSEDILKDTAFVFSGFSPKSNHEGIPHTEDTDGDGHCQTERPRNVFGSKDKPPSVIRLTGSDYRNALANQRRPNSMQKEVESENGSSKDKHLEKGRAKKMVRSTVSLSSSVKNLNDDGAVVHSSFQKNKEMPHSEDADASGRKDKGSNMISPTGLEDKDAVFEDKMRPNKTRKMAVSEKGSSKRGLACEDQESDAGSNNKFINWNTSNASKWRLDALKDLLIQWEAGISNLESIVAVYIRNHANASDENKV